MAFFEIPTPHKGAKVFQVPFSLPKVPLPCLWQSNTLLWVASQATTLLVIVFTTCICIASLTFYITVRVICIQATENLLQTCLKK